MIQILAAHLVGGEQHEHIAQVQYRQLPNGPIRKVTRAQIVARLDQQPGDTVVPEASVAYTYIRTHADSHYNDNLLVLQRY